MFSEASVCSRGEGAGVVCPWKEGLPPKGGPPPKGVGSGLKEAGGLPPKGGGRCLQGRDPPLGGVCPTSPVLTSSSGHCSSRYASYWNAFLFGKIFAQNAWIWKNVLFVFMQFSGKKAKYCPPSLGLGSPSWKYWIRHGICSTETGIYHQELHRRKYSTEVFIRTFDA